MNIYICISLSHSLCICVLLTVSTSGSLLHPDTQVVVLTTRTLPSIPHKSAQEVSFIINTADEKALLGRRRSSLIGWESSLEDVQVTSGTDILAHSLQAITYET